MTFQFISDETRLLNPKWFRVSKLTGEGTAVSERQSAARPPHSSLVIYCEIARDSMWRAGEWVLLIREAFLLHRALFLFEWACMKWVCSLPVPHALVEAACSSVYGLSDVLGGWRGCEWGGRGGKNHQYWVPEGKLCCVDWGYVLFLCRSGLILLF